MSPNDRPLFPRRVGDYFNCRRGIATGANEFFCLNQSAMRQYALRLDQVDPCVAKAVDANGLVFSAQKLAALVSADRPCYLLNPRRNDSGLERYLQRGEL